MVFCFVPVLIVRELEYRALKDDLVVPTSEKRSRRLTIEIYVGHAALRCVKWKTPLVRMAKIIRK